MENIWIYFKHEKVEPDSDGTIRIRHNLNTNSFSWIVLGDWGGWPAPHFTNPIQTSVANSMGRTVWVCQSLSLCEIG